MDLIPLAHAGRGVRALGAVAPRARRGRPRARTALAATPGPELEELPTSIGVDPREWDPTATHIDAQVGRMVSVERVEEFAEHPGGGKGLFDRGEVSGVG